jgi:DNA ligase (NAD+)
MDQIYFGGGGRPADDSIYDELKHELKHLAPDDERLTRVGAPVPSDGILKKVAHVHPMGSLDNVMNEAEFLAWHELIKAAYGYEPAYNVTFKMDGGSVALIYKDGYMVQAITRGDGQEGEDITANALRMKGVPRYVERHVKGEQAYQPFTGSVRGEVMLYNADWKALDPDQLSNPRNLGNGISRRKDGEDTERLTFVVFRAFDSDGYPLGKTENDMLSALPPMGFEVVKGWGNCTAADVVKFYRLMQADAGQEIGFTRDTLPFEIDGLVIKVEDLVFQSMVEDTSIRPKAQRALKFPPRAAYTTLIDVEWTVGHTGTIIPTAVLEPVKIGGVEVSRALLCNMDEIGRLDVGVGDRVKVIRAGDVIPKIVSSDKLWDRVEIKTPTACPACDGKVGKKQGLSGDDSVHLYCLNPQCSAQQLGKIKTWVRKLDIQGLGDVFLEDLFESRGLVSAADLYRLKDSPHGRSALEDVVGRARTPKILAEIEKKRTLSLSNFLGCLGIDGLGRRRVILVQQALPGEFDKLSDWLSGKLVEKAAEVGLPNLAKEIQERIMANQDLITDLIDAGVNIGEEPTKAPEPAKEGQLVICLTGKFDKPKKFYHDEIVAAGHRYEESYRKGLSYLVTANPAVLSSKTKKAQKDGVEVISADQLLALIK